MAWSAIILLIIQFSLLAIFCFFAFFNYLYSIASFSKPKIRRVQASRRRIAVVIVSFNEKYVLEETIRACQKLSYRNKVIVLADDSNDPEIVQKYRRFAKSRGCRRVERCQFFQEMEDESTGPCKEPIEIWESQWFVYFHRPRNVGFKGGSLKKVHQYLDHCGIELMYLLDADWHPQKDALDRTLEVLEAGNDIAFVQTKRISPPEGMNLFQKYVALHEEGCYNVDFPGRQVLGHPILFSGCCTLLRLDAIAEVGYFTPGHLTEDLDLTDRLWLNGWRGVYLEDVVNYGEVPFAYDHLRRQQERWAAGSARCLREYLWRVLKYRKFNWFERLSVVRQNSYFAGNLITAGAFLLGIVTVAWIGRFWNTYSVEYYLYVMEFCRIPFVVLVYLCVFSNFIQPLITILFKRRTYSDLIHLPMSIWYAWSNLITYFIGNIRGLFRLNLDWFCTPKFIRGREEKRAGMPLSIRILNFCLFVAFLSFYFYEGWAFGWIDGFSLLWLPAFFLANTSK